MRDGPHGATKPGGIPELNGQDGKERVPDWIRRHRSVWVKKRSLRHYYQSEIFDRLIAGMVGGRTLELGAGPGFFAEYHPGHLTTDILFSPNITVCSDAHALPFRDNVFGNVVGIDVLHHLARPAEALREIGRVLLPKGRLLLVEPWAGPFAALVYKLFHHEDCRIVEDPWNQPFADDKDAMEGNTMIPKLLLWDRVHELPGQVETLRVDRVEPFGGFSYLLTGGFHRWGFPAAVTEFLCRVERPLSPRVMELMGTRVLCILEKKK